MAVWVWNSVHEERGEEKREVRREGEVRRGEERGGGEVRREGEER